MRTLRYVTSSERDLGIARNILAGVEVSAIPPLPELAQDSDPSEAARKQAGAAFERTRIPCFAVAESVVFDLESKTSRSAFVAADFARNGIPSDLEGRPGLLRHCLAFTSDGKSHVTFVSDNPGKSLSPRNTLKTLTIDDVWLPNGYTVPLASLSNARTIHKRHRLLFDLAGHLNLPAASDIYEVHITVEPQGLSLDMFRAACKLVGVKAIHIELPEGAVPSHWITSSFHRGSFEHALGDAQAVGRQLEGFGFRVTRVKIEAMIRNSLVPISDQDATAGPLGSYFEFHTKVPVAGPNDLSCLRALCSRWGAHLSRNASNRMETGASLYFITFRVHRLGRERALQAFEGLLHDLHSLGFVTSNILREYTVYDTNTTLDDGWYPVVPGISSTVSNY